MIFRKILHGAVMLIILFLLGACSKNVQLYRQAVKEYNQGQFEKSLATNVSSLELKRTYVKAQNLVQKNFPKVVADREARIASLRAAAQEDMWDQLVVEYQSLIAIQKLVSPFNPLYNPKTGTAFEFTLKDYLPELTKSTENAAEFHYAKGLAIAASGGSPDIQRQAADQFKLAQKYIPNYKDSAQRYDSSRQQAVKRIAILAFEDKSGVRNRYGGIIDMLTEAIIGKLVQDKEATAYMEIVTRDQINAVLAERQLTSPGVSEETLGTTLGSLLGADEILTGKILQINYVPPRTTYLELKETDKIEVKQEVVDGKGKKKTEKVKTDITCNFNKYTKTASVQIIASFAMVEVATGKVKLQDTVTSEYPWTDFWVRVTGGDERALAPATKALANKAEPLPPSEVEMVNTALATLSDIIVDKVRNYVK